MKHVETTAAALLARIEETARRNNERIRDEVEEAKRILAEREAALRAMPQSWNEALSKAVAVATFEIENTHDRAVTVDAIGLGANSPASTCLMRTGPSSWAPSERAAVAFEIKPKQRMRAVVLIMPVESSEEPPV